MPELKNFRPLLNVGDLLQKPETALIVAVDTKEQLLDAVVYFGGGTFSMRKRNWSVTNPGMHSSCTRESEESTYPAYYQGHAGCLENCLYLDFV